MAIKVTWHGHATFEMHVGEHAVLVDPFFTDNPAATVSPDDVPANFILITHGHGDHVGDALRIADRTRAMIISNYEICNWINGKGPYIVHPQHIGGGFPHPFGYVKMTMAQHGSAMPDGSYGGNPGGFLVTAEEKRIYFAGDTGLFASMRLYGDEGIDLAFLPIGDNFTMGPEDAFRAVGLLRPRTVVPIHYGTWPMIAQNAEAWAERVNRETESRAVVLKPGESIEV